MIEAKTLDFEKDNLTLKKLQGVPPIVKSLMFYLLALCLCCLASLVSSRPVFAETPKPAASVNGVAISENEVDAMIDQLIPSLAYHPELAIEKKGRYRGQAIEQLIISQLLYQYAVSLGMTLSEAEVRKAMDEQRSQFNSNAEFESAIANKGITPAEFEKDIRRSLLIGKVLREKVEGPSVPAPSVVRDYYDENKKQFVDPEKIRIDEIFIYIAPYAEDSEVKEKTGRATEVLGKIKSGEDFCKLASEYSDDNLSAKCGDMGYIHKGMLDEQIEKEVWNMKETEVRMVTTDKGMMIVRLKEHKIERQIEFGEMKPRIERELTGKKRKQLNDELIKGLREKAKIEIYEK